LLRFNPFLKNNDAVYTLPPWPKKTKKKIKQKEIKTITTLTWTNSEKQNAYVLARKLGYKVTKVDSRHGTSINNLGGYKLISPDNTVVLGAKFDALPSQIIDYLNTKEN
jgi:hypothetical protein